MADGQQVLNKITRQVTKASGQVTEARSTLTDLRSQELELRGSMTRIAAELASMHAHMIEDGKLETYTDAHMRVSKDLESRARRLDTLKTELAARVDNRRGLRQALQQAIDSRTAAAATLTARETRLNDALVKDPEVVRSRQALDTASAAVSALTARITEARADQKAKLASFQSDMLFQYLLACQYATPGYSRTGFVSRMDGYVAGVCGFEKARRTYELLLQLPDYVERQLAAATARKTDAIQANTVLEQSFEAYADMKAAAEALERKRLLADKADESVDHAQKEIDMIAAEIDLFPSFKDTLGREISAYLKCVYDEAEVAELEKMAAATPDKADDLLVSQLGTARARLAEVRAEIAAHSETLADLERAERRAKEFQTRFRSSGRANDDYRYSDSSVDSFVTGFFTGQLSVDSAASSLSSQAREVERSSYSSSSSSSSSDSSSSFGSSGFSSGSSFGGGGFSSGDSF